MVRSLIQYLAICKSENLANYNFCQSRFNFWPKWQKLVTLEARFNKGGVICIFPLDTNVPVLCSLLFERLLSGGIISWKLCKILHLLNLTEIMVLPIFIINLKYEFIGPGKDWFSVEILDRVFWGVFRVRFCVGRLKGISEKGNCRDKITILSYTLGRDCLENTHHRRKYHSNSELLFDWFGFD